MSLFRARLLGTASARAQAKACFVSFAPFSVLQGQAEDFLIGEIFVIGYSGPFEVVLDPGLGDLVKVTALGNRRFIKTGPTATTIQSELLIKGAALIPGDISLPFSGTAPVISVTTLTDLPLDDAEFAYALTAGAEMEDLGAPLPGETRTISPDDGRVVFSAGYDKLLRGLTAWNDASTIEFTVTRILSGAVNSPHPTSWTVTIAAEVTPEPARIIPGTLATGLWATTDPSLLGLGSQGSASDYGFFQPPIGVMTSGMFDKVTGLKLFGSSWYSLPSVSDVQAGDYRAMTSVWYSIKGGPWFVVTQDQMIVDPESGNMIFPCWVHSDDFATSQYDVEMRVIGVPKVGQPIVLQGLLNPKTDPNYGGPGANNGPAFCPVGWSTRFAVDKTGTDLPHGMVFLDDTNGNDANTGDSLEQAVATLEAAHTKLLAQHAAQGFDGTDCGFGEVVLGPGCTHLGRAGTPSEPWKATYGWLKFRPYDGASPGSYTYHAPTNTSTFVEGDVHITTTTTWGPYCEKLWLDGFTKSIRIDNRDNSGNNYASLDYPSFRLTNILHDGGPGVDANGQYTGSEFAGVGRGWVEMVGCVMYRVENGAITNSTLLKNVIMDGSSEKGDFLNSAKAVIKVTGRNAWDLVSGNHLDGAQWYGSRSFVVVEDLDLRTGWIAQCVLLTNGFNSHFVLVRLRLNTGGFAGPALSIGDGGQNIILIDPEVSGATDGFVPTTVTDMRVVMTPTSVGGGFASIRRAGRTVIWPDTVEEPADAPAAPDIIATTLGADRFIGLNADDPFTINTAAAITSVTEWLQQTAGTPFLARPLSPKPLLVPGHFGAFDGLALNGINTGTNSGSNFAKGGSNAEIQGANPVEIFIGIDQQDLNTLDFLRWIAGYGTSTAYRAIFKAKPVLGVRNKLQWRVSNTSGGSTNTLDHPGDFSGKGVIHAWADPANATYAIGWHQSSYSLANYATGALAGTIDTGSSGAQHVIGGPPATGGGNGGWPKAVYNRYEVSKTILEVGRRQTIIEEMLAKVLA